MELFAHRGYFFCRYCGSFHFPDTKADDGIRIVGDTAQPMACAVCSKPLTMAMLDETQPISILPELPRRADRAEVLRGGCAEAALLGYRYSRAGRSSNPKSSRAKCAARRALDRWLTHPYYGPGNVVLDSCEKCELVWLDFGELRQIVDAPGKDRGSANSLDRSGASRWATALLDSGSWGSGPSDVDDSDALFLPGKTLLAPR